MNAKQTLIRFITFISLFMAALNLMSAEATPAPMNLRCEYFENPLGIEETRPRLSWWMTPREGERNQRQSAYQILVAESRETLERDLGETWDSGKVTSSESVFVTFKGAELESRKRYWWKVRSWDEQGEVSAWSEPAFWEMGLLQPVDWSAQWIAIREDASNKIPPEPAPFFRKQFSLKDKPVHRARAYATGLGYFEMSLNGEKVGDHQLDPLVTHYDHRVYYLTFDITELLEPGENLAGMILGSGWYNLNDGGAWGFTRATWRGLPRMICQIEVEYADGEVQRIVSDDSWKVTTGPITFEGLYNGEHYDARLEMPGWNRPGFDDAEWSPAAVIAAPEGRLAAQMIEPMRDTETFEPSDVVEVAPGVWRFDFPQNIAGNVELRVQAPAGTEIVLKHGEVLNGDGTLNLRQIARFKKGPVQTDRYICRGEGVEIWSPRFVYHGFQHVQVEGLPEAPSPDMLTARAIHTDFDSVGNFACSNQLLNQIQHAARWSFRGNFHGYPEDCPHREKIGWTGDAHIAGQALLFNFDVAAGLTSWIANFPDVQRENGQLPAIIPTSGWGFDYSGWDHRPSIEWHREQGYSERGYGPQWEGAFVLTPWLLYVNRGDLRLVQKMYPEMVRYLDYLSAHAEDRMINFGIGDHKAPHPGTPAAGFATGYYLRIAEIMAEFADRLDRTDDAQRFAQLANEIRAAYHRNLYNPDTGLYYDIPGLEYANGSDTAQAAALYFNVVPPDLRESLLNKLIAQIEEREMQHTCGVVGVTFLMNALAEHGRADFAYRLATRDERPSWGWWMTQGATTLWQTWSSGGSHNHQMFGDISAWFYTYIAGLRPDPEHPGYRHFFVEPESFESLQWAEAEHTSPYGAISIRWEATGTAFTLHLTVPPNSMATVRLPVASLAAVRESGQPLNSEMRTQLLDTPSGPKAAISVGSGDYEFTCALGNVEQASPVD